MAGKERALGRCVCPFPRVPLVPLLLAPEEKQFEGDKNIHARGPDSLCLGLHPSTRIFFTDFFMTPQGIGDREARVIMSFIEDQGLSLKPLKRPIPIHCV